MRNRGESVVDLLEIYHARRLRDQIIAQLKRIASAEAHGFPIDEAVHRKAGRYYEAMLITVADLLEGLGDRRPLD